jgi:hypothetical protein
VGAAVDVAVGAAVAAGVGVGLTALVGVALAVTHGSSRSQSGSSFPPPQAEHKAANASAKATPRIPGMVLVMAMTASCSECPRVKTGAESEQAADGSIHINGSKFTPNACFLQNLI